MPRIDDVTKGVALGIGVAMLIPVAYRVLAPVLKPVARSAVKSGILAIEKGREMLAETSEKVEDLVAETQADMRAQRMHVEEEAVEVAEESVQPDDQSNVRNIVNE